MICWQTLRSVEMRRDTRAGQIMELNRGKSRLRARHARTCPGLPRQRGVISRFLQSFEHLSATQPSSQCSHPHNHIRPSCSVIVTAHMRGCALRERDREPKLGAETARIRRHDEHMPALVLSPCRARSDGRVRERTGRRRTDSEARAVGHGIVCCNVRRARQAIRKGNAPKDHALMTTAQSESAWALGDYENSYDDRPAPQMLHD